MVSWSSCHQPSPGTQTLSPLPRVASRPPSPFVPPPSCLLLQVALPVGPRPLPHLVSQAGPHPNQGSVRIRGQHGAHIQARARGPSHPLMPVLMALDLCQHRDKPRAGEDWGAGAPPGAAWKFPWSQDGNLSYQCGNNRCPPQTAPFISFQEAVQTGFVHPFETNMVGPNALPSVHESETSIFSSWAGWRPSTPQGFLACSPVCAPVHFP